MKSSLRPDYPGKSVPAPLLERRRAVGKHVEADRAHLRSVVRWDQPKGPATWSGNVDDAGSAWDGDHRRRLAGRPRLDDELNGVAEHPQDLVRAAVDSRTWACDQPSREDKCDRIARRGDGPWHGPGRSARVRPSGLRPLGRLPVGEHGARAAAGQLVARLAGRDCGRSGRRLIARDRRHQDEGADASQMSPAEPHAGSMPLGPRGFPARTLIKR